METITRQHTKQIYIYVVIKPIIDYGWNKKIDDLMTHRDMLTLPPYYKKFVTYLQSPIIK